MSISLQAGRRIRLHGGYDLNPHWLQGRTEYFGAVSGFIPGQNGNLALVVQLDEPLTVDEALGNMVVLELRYVGARWVDSNVVHVELCDFIPEHKPWQDRRQGKWIESHATCDLIV